VARSCAFAIGQCIGRLLQLLLLQLLLRIAFDLCKVESYGHIENIVQGFECTTDLGPWVNILLENIVEASKSIIIHDLFVLPMIPPSFCLLSLLMIHIGSD